MTDSSNTLQGGQYPTHALTGLTVEVKAYDGSAKGIRRVDAVGSQLIVHAGPVDQVASIAKLADLRDRTVAYVLVADRDRRAYVGKGSTNSRLVYQTGNCGTARRFDARQVFVLHARDPRADDESAIYIEAKLAERGFFVGAPLTNALVPRARFTDGTSLVDPEQMVEEALLFLPVAGCGIFEPSDVPHHDADAPLQDGYRIIPADDYTPPEDAVLLRLTHHKLVCEGYRLDEGRFLVRPGSQFLIKKTTVGLREANLRRRTAILGRGILQAVPARPDRMLLTGSWIEFEDEVMAARVLCATHRYHATWEPVEDAAVANGLDLGGGDAYAC